MKSKGQSETGGSQGSGRIGYRPYWVVLFSVGIRAVHQVGAAVFLSAYLLDRVEGSPVFYLAVSAVSGTVLLFTEGLRHRQIYREVSGLATAVKLLLLGAAYHHYLPPAGTVLAAFLIASLAAHLPKELRHRLVI